MWYGHQCHVKIYAEDDDVKITQWNKHCVKSVWMNPVESEEWIKIVDRVPVTDAMRSPVVGETSSS